MDLHDYCKCKNSSAVYTETDDHYQYDICNDCRKVIEDGIRPIDIDEDVL